MEVAQVVKSEASERHLGLCPGLRAAEHQLAPPAGHRLICPTARMIEQHRRADRRRNSRQSLVSRAIKPNHSSFVPLADNRELASRMVEVASLGHHQLILSTTSFPGGKNQVRHVPGSRGNRALYIGHVRKGDWITTLLKPPPRRECRIFFNPIVVNCVLEHARNGRQVAFYCGVASALFAAVPNHSS